MIHHYDLGSLGDLSIVRNVELSKTGEIDNHVKLDPIFSSDHKCREDLLEDCMKTRKKETKRRISKLKLNLQVYFHTARFVRTGRLTNLHVALRVVCPNRSMQSVGIKLGMNTRQFDRRFFWRFA